MYTVSEIDTLVCPKQKNSSLERLLNYEGSLMAFAGKSDKKENVTAAITANIWMSNEKSAKGALPDETLNYIVLDCLVSSAVAS